MTNGCHIAIDRAVHGLPPKVWRMAYNEVRKKSSLCSICSVSSKEESGEVTYVVFPRIPGNICHDPFSPPLAHFTFSPEELELTLVDNPEIKEASMHLLEMFKLLVTQRERDDGFARVVSSLNIELLYPISGKPSQQSDVALKSPLDILITGKRELASLAKGLLEVY